MNTRLIRSYFLCVFFLVTAVLPAQRLVRDEYRAEIGLGAGTSYYLGEANSTLFGNMKPAFSGFFRYRFDTRLALKAELGQLTVAGEGITNPLYVGDITGEFNFFDLEQNPYKRFSKTYSPYIFTGLCLSTDVYDGQPLPQFGIPFGLGLKVKLRDRLNLNVQWTTRLMFSDNYEGKYDREKEDNFNKYTNPAGLNGSNFLNNDFVSNLMVGLSIDIWKKDCDCKNNYSKLK